MTTEAQGGLPSTALISLSEFMARSLPPKNQETGRINPVGIILYAGRSRMAMIGSLTDEKLNGALICSDQATPEGFDENQVFDGKNRIIDLSDYEHLNVLQVSFAAVRIETFRSIHTLPSVNVTIPTKNPEKGQEEIINVDEEELLRVFTGENGGIAVFSGANLPEENALVLRRDTNGGSKSGLALFMYPDTSSLTAFDSVDGFYAFLKALNQEFIDTPRYPLQAESLRAFEHALRTGEYNFRGIEVREELFRTMVIANTRLAARLRQPQYKEFLKAHLRAGRAHSLRRLLMKIGIGMKDKSLQSLANLAIDRLVSGEQIPEDQTTLLPVQSKEDNNERFLSKLRTQKARQIWHTVGDDYKDNSHGRRWNFTADIIRFIEGAGSLDEIDDALDSLRRLEKSEFKNVNFEYTLDVNGRISWDRLHHDSNTHKAQELIEYLKILVSERKTNFHY